MFIYLIKCMPYISSTIFHIFLAMRTHCRCFHYHFYFPFQSYGHKLHKRAVQIWMSILLATVKSYKWLLKEVEIRISTMKIFIDWIAKQKYIIKGKMRYRRNKNWFADSLKCTFQMNHTESKEVNVIYCHCIWCGSSFCAAHTYFIL